MKFGKWAIIRAADKMETCAPDRHPHGGMAATRCRGHYEAKGRESSERAGKWIRGKGEAVRYGTPPLCLKSGQVETVKIHDLDPCLDKVLYELLLGILACIEFCKGAKL